MKQGLIIIFAVAVLGTTGWYARSHNSGGVAGLVASSSSNKSAISSAGQSDNSSNTTDQVSSNSNYKDGTYTGSSADTPYGTVQVAAVIKSGKITDIKFLKMPEGEQHSQEVTNVSTPILKQETLTSQSWSVDFITGATSTCYGYQESLQAALDQAKIS